MNYLYLIKKLLNYELYVKYRNHIKVEKDQKEIYYLFKALDQMMEQFKHDLTFDDYALWVQVNFGNDYVPFLTLIKEQDTDEDVLEATLKAIKERALAFTIAQKALSVSEGKADFNEVVDLCTQFEVEQAVKESPFVSTSLTELFDEAYKHQGLRWRLTTLNQSLGSLRKGDFGFIFARPETGKTTFLASEASAFATQIAADAGPGIWFNNEEQHKKVMLRIIQASLGIPMHELSRRLPYYEAQYKEVTGDKILIPNLGIIHRREVEAICKEYQPSFIVIDQLPKIKGFTNDRHDLQLGATFEWARDLAKEYCPVIGVSQADGSGEGKKWLTMENVANSKTAVQAEADFILGIGKTHDAGFEMIRYLNISKNKLLGDEDTQPEKRHGKMEVLIQTEIARYRDI